MVQDIKDKNIKDFNAGENSNTFNKEEYIKEIRDNFNKDNAFEQLVTDLKYYYTEDEEAIKKFANKDDSILKELIKDTDEQSYYNYDKFHAVEIGYLIDMINENNETDEEGKTKLDSFHDMDRFMEGFKNQKTLEDKKNYIASDYSSENSNTFNKEEYISKWVSHLKYTGWYESEAYLDAPLNDKDAMNLKRSN